MSDIRDDVRHTFVEVFGHEALGLWSAPGRLALLGSLPRSGALAPPDSPRHPLPTPDNPGTGLALSLAINRRTVIALGIRDDAVIRIASEYADEVVEVALDQVASVALTGWSGHALGGVLALAANGADLAAVPGVDIYVASSIPVGAGLGSSSALQAAIAFALREVWRLDLDDRRLARILSADGAAVILGREDHAVLTQGFDTPDELLALGFASDDTAILVIDTGLPDENAHLGATAHEIEAENARVRDAVAGLRAAGAARLGELLDASDRALRAASASDSPGQDLAAEVARANGALGARRLVAPRGATGCVVVLARQDEVSRIQVSIDGAFAEHGFEQPTIEIVQASGGALRE